MTLLEQLEQVTSEERAALIAGDWRALQACVEHKNALAQQIASISLTDAEVPKARRLSQATRYNLELASALSRQLGDLLSYKQRESVYDQRGRLARRTPGIMRVTG